MNYDQLDAAILTAIAGGNRKFYIINATVEHLAKPHSLRGDAFRVVDRRLQALRKRGVIEYKKGDWQFAAHVERKDEHGM